MNQNWFVIAKSLIRYFALCCIIYAVCMSLLYQITYNTEERATHFFLPRYNVTVKESNYLINTNGCKISNMDPFDQSIMKYLYRPKWKNITINNTIYKYIDDKNDNNRPPNCTGYRFPPPQPLILSNLTHLIVNDESIAQHNVENVYCCYTPFWRIPVTDKTKQKYSKEFDDKFESADTCIDFEKQVCIENHEFVKVECFSDVNKTNSIYKDFHSFIPLKENVEKHCNKFNKYVQKNKFSVLTIGIDAVSRLNFIRQMPNTYDYIINKLKGIEMLGYNKVGDNTFPNLIPVLTGYSQNELKNICWPNDYYNFDDCPFIWNNYKENGYRTCFAEDACWMGIFTYGKQGFQEQPTDYYGRTFVRRAEYAIGSDERLNAYLCVGYRLTLEVLLNYIEKFVLTMLNKLFFGFFWTVSLSHDYENLPRYGDESYTNLFNKFEKSSVFNDTILIVLSDHGIRYGAIRSTYQGYLEERLPFLYFVLPERFKKNYKIAAENLRKNTRKLSTPYDLHETLDDILNLNKIKPKLLRKRTIELYEMNKYPRGISLFLPIPPNRTCDDAEILLHYCTCIQPQETEMNSSVVRLAVNHVITEINGYLHGYSQCETLYLKRIISARKYLAKVEKENSKLNSPFYDFLVTFEVSPSSAKFEATVRKKSDDTFLTVGSISRINIYGTQSYCVTNYRLKLYCYCT